MIDDRPAGDWSPPAAEGHPSTAGVPDGGAAAGDMRAAHPHPLDETSAQLDERMRAPLADVDEDAIADELYDFAVAGDAYVDQVRAAIEADQHVPTGHERLADQLARISDVVAAPGPPGVEHDAWAAYLATALGSVLDAVGKTRADVIAIHAATPAADPTEHP